MLGFFFVCLFCHTVTDYDDLVVPLCKHCPAALNVPNNAGVTPHELLQGLTFKQVGCDPVFSDFFISGLVCPETGMVIFLLLTHHIYLIRSETWGGKKVWMYSANVYCKDDEMIVCRLRLVICLFHQLLEEALVNTSIHPSILFSVIRISTFQ